MSVTLHGKPARFDGGLREVGDGCWAWLQPDGGWGEVNAGLVVGDGASAVVDTLWDQPRARQMLAAMEPHTRQAPIALAVNTHSDGDHWWGNAELPAKAEIVTSRASLETMREETPPAGMARLRSLARMVRRAPGGAGAMGRYVSAMLKPFDFEHVELRFPERVFAGQRSETVGGRELRLVEVGPAHTPGDLIVHVPDAGVVFAADILFVGVTPVMWAGPLANWLRALDLLLELDADIFVPGHGPVGRTRRRRGAARLLAVARRRRPPPPRRRPQRAAGRAGADPRARVRPLPRLDLPGADRPQRDDAPPPALRQGAGAVEPAGARPPVRPHRRARERARDAAAMTGRAGGAAEALSGARLAAMATSRAIRAAVSGRVQGVGFRAATIEAARAHGLLGWVRNDDDGVVRVHAEGDAEQVERFVAWLHDGPPAAQVERVEVEAVRRGATSSSRSAASRPGSSSSRSIRRPRTTGTCGWRSTA